MTAMSSISAKQQLEAMFRCALAAVHGKAVVGEALSRRPLAGQVSVVAIGKAAAALQAADAGSCLAASGDLFATGPTGTNAMDMVIGLKLPEGSGNE